MRAMQSSTASVGNEASGQFAALQFVSRRLDLGIVDETTGIEGLTREDDLVPRNRHETGALQVAEGAGLAHDAGNLLGALSLYSELLAAPGVLNEEFRDYADELRMLSERSHAMIARLVEHARVRESETDEMTVLPVVVKQCRGLLSRQLHQVLVALVHNALTYGRLPGQPARVTLHIAQPHGPQIDVMDRGPGIPETVAAQLFRPFFTTSGHGTGLGLYIARELCRANQATLEYVPMPGGGCCFRIRLAGPHSLLPA